MTSARERLVIGTIGLLRSRGVEATGVADIVAASGAARRSLYSHFPNGKMQLMVEATRRAGGEIDGAIRTFAKGDDPVAGLRSFIASWKVMMQSEDFSSGCPVAMAALGSFDTPELAREAASVFSSWQDALSEQLSRAGLISTVAASFASFAVSAIEGAVVQCLAYRSTQPLDAVDEHLSSALRVHLGSQEGSE
jgi:TetR/AcrR family transcriptional regulator, lmrAB and yxaGH operons repressor